jgi:hypothetical protein
MEQDVSQNEAAVFGLQKSPPGLGGRDAPPGRLERPIVALRHRFPFLVDPIPVCHGQLAARSDSELTGYASRVTEGGTTRLSVGVPCQA